ncbi:hypothetical protein DCC39_14400 [Pueribacillus theae]|uniref:Uncharacterized protein n=1 Tax=Pueribacillus theae TaxID=2171751 RepID=A0A2U1JTU3_9BACI|nr:hypothetical protein [Pueribacillus theae]PWA08627.1 hypothetical protein DCC39_14400 [Pueribacillus theae]
MSKTQCFKIKRGTVYDKAAKEHFELLPKWKNVFSRLSDLLEEEITKMAFSPHILRLDPSEFTKEENKKLFRKDGVLKSNTNKAKNLFKDYQKIIEEEGLSKFEELRHINFIYGVMRMRHQHLESFRTSENDIYYKADFDLEKKTNGLVIPISEIEYEEKYLEELKKKA